MGWGEVHDAEFKLMAAEISRSGSSLARGGRADGAADSDGHRPAASRLCAAPFLQQFEDQEELFLLSAGTLQRLRKRQADHFGGNAGDANA